MKSKARVLKHKLLWLRLKTFAISSNEILVSVPNPFNAKIPTILLVLASWCGRGSSFTILFLTYVFIYS